MSPKLARLGLTPDAVRRLTGGTQRKEPAANIIPVRRKGNNRCKCGTGCNVDKVRAWLKSARPGEECSWKSLDLPSSWSGTVAFNLFVRQGEIKLVRPAAIGRHASPAIYAKL